MDCSKFFPKGFRSGEKKMKGSVKSGCNIFNRKWSGDDEWERTPWNLPAGRTHGRKCKPSPDRISPETARKIALFAVCQKTQIKRTNQQRQKERKQPKEADKGSRAAADHPDGGRQTKPSRRRGDQDRQPAMIRRPDRQPPHLSRQQGRQTAKKVISIFCYR